ncbi:hypothetical protein ACFQAQ_26075 [Novosphingobium resinovorum]|uniref:hypothetical protein n=1 Tax=Novosphingobium resinovorum TaxID=158500 RepID=UPI00360BC650
MKDGPTTGLQYAGDPWEDRIAVELKNREQLGPVVLDHQQSAVLDRLVNGLDRFMLQQLSHLLSGQRAACSIDHAPLEGNGFRELLCRLGIIGFDSGDTAREVEYQTGYIDAADGRRLGGSRHQLDDALRARHDTVPEELIGVYKSRIRQACHWIIPVQSVSYTADTKLFQPHGHEHGDIMVTGVGVQGINED